jgi:CheY-like chemotaxis protein
MRILRRSGAVLPTGMNNRPKKLSVLCADADTLPGEALIRLLTQAGHAVEHVVDGLGAWEKLSADLRRFDILITGHHMPGLTGLGLVELLRQADYPGRIIVHSSALTANETERYRALGVASIVVKPTAAAALLGLVEAFNQS